MVEWPDDPDLVPAEVVSGKVVTCDLRGSREVLGPYEQLQAENPVTSKAYLWSGGVLAGDLDDDGDVDIVAPSEPDAHLYRGQADGRVRRWPAAFGDVELDLGSGGSLADYDADGDLDILLLRWERPNVLLRNDGGGTFTDVTTEVGLGASAASTASAWGDLDRDGDLDLFVGSYDDLEGEGVVGGSFLYENLGGYFADRSDRLPPELDVAYTRVAGFHDLDADGLLDLYVVNDVGSVQGNILLYNQGQLTFARDEHGSLDLPMSGGGLGVGDVNGDGLPDMLIPQWDQISLMLSGDGGRWFDYADVVGLTSDTTRGQRVGWGAELADMDNDGDLDAIVAYGHLEVDLPTPDWDNPTRQPDALFLQQDDGTFVDVATEWGIADEGTGRGFVLADLNDDGWLDIAKRELDGPDLLYVSRCGRNHWLRIRLSDPTSLNPLGVGAQVRVVGPSQTWTRTITAGGTGFGTGGPAELHVGLGRVQQVERIEVTWPDGAESWVGFGLQTDREIQIIRSRPAVVAR